MMEIRNHVLIALDEAENVDVDVDLTDNEVLLYGYNSKSNDNWTLCLPNTKKTRNLLLEIQRALDMLNVPAQRPTEP